MTEKAGSDQVGTDDCRYQAPAFSYEAIYTHEEKRSRFICHLFPVKTDDEAMEKIGDIRNRYIDASHNCFAYILLNRGVTAVRFSDDGEPGGTAGQPILKSLELNGMAESLAIVTRYFGGILLGAGGLSRAYSKAVSKGLELASKAILIECREVFVTVNYHEYGKLENYLKENPVTVSKTEYTEHVKICLYASTSMIPAVLQAIKDITRGTAKTSVGKTEIRKAVKGIIL